MSCRTVVSTGVLTAVLALVGVPTFAASRYRVLHNFAGGKDSNGPLLFVALAVDRKGNLFGPGGSLYGQRCQEFSCGLVFEMKRGVGGRWSETVVFRITDPQTQGVLNSPITFDRQGNLYGCTGGLDLVFQLRLGRNGWSFTPVWNGGCADAVGVIPDSVGNLFGSLGPSGPNGGIGKLAHGADGWMYTDLYNFCWQQKGCPDGVWPLAPLSWDSKGNLYGTTYEGGPSYPGCYCGAAFQMTPNTDGSWTYHVLHRFGAFKNDGQYPYGSMTVDASGNAYGTTTHGGGSYTAGTVFKLAPTKSGLWKEILIFDFQKVSNRGYGAPGGNLVFDNAGNLYGTAGSSLCNGTCGIVFKLAPQPSGQWKFSLVHQFTGPDGNYPNGLTMDSQGKLYGTTSGGGKYNYGVVFEITP